MDVRDEGAVERAVRQLLEAEDGRLYGAVCNAGFGIFGRQFASFTGDALEAISIFDAVSDEQA